MKCPRLRNPNIALFAAFIFIFGLAFMRVHMRVQSTLIGYKLGALKKREATLLEQRSGLQMQLAQITRREHLAMLAKGDDGSESQALGSVVLR